MSDDDLGESKTEYYRELWRSLYAAYRERESGVENFKRLSAVIDGHEEKTVPARMARFVCRGCSFDFARKYHVSDRDINLDEEVWIKSCWERPEDHWAYRHFSEFDICAQSLTAAMAQLVKTYTL